MLNSLNRPKAMRNQIVIASLIFVLSSVACQSVKGAVTFEGMLLEPGVSIKGLKIPLGNGPESFPTIVLKADEVSLEPRKIGFFSLAVIPQVIINDGIFSIQEGVSPRDWTQVMVAFLKENPSLEHCLVRKFELHIGSGDTFRIQAEEASFSPQAKQILLNRVRWHDSTGDHSARSAALALDGREMGIVINRSGETIIESNPKSPISQ